MQIWGKKWSLNNKILRQKCGLWSLKTGGLLMQVKIIVITLGRIWKWSLNTGGLLIEVVFRSGLTVDLADGGYEVFMEYVKAKEHKVLY